MLKAVPIHIKVFRNAMEVTRLDKLTSIRRQSPDEFSSSRLLIADFHTAEIFLRSLLKELIPGKFFLSPAHHALVQAMEMYEGGLSSVELRTFRDLAEHSGASKVLVYPGDIAISSLAALEKLKNEKQ